MRSLTIRAATVAAAALVLFAAGSARAATLDVNVPFPFLVQGRTLPAGEYRITNEAGLVELQGEKGNHANLYVLTMPADGHDPAGDTPALTFKHDDKQYRLTDIWESRTDGIAPVRHRS
ncbi:MAG: hypothetical protein AB7Q29_13780 [Vicinamibacterales bacterium]